MLELFIEHRVLRESVWFFSELVDPWDATKTNQLKSALRRLVEPNPVFRRQRLPRVERVRRHLAELGGMLGSYSRRPGSLVDDFAVERWTAGHYAEPASGPPAGAMSSV